MNSVCEFKEHCTVPQLKVKSSQRVELPCDTGHMVPDAVAITHCPVLSPGNNVSRARIATGKCTEGVTWFGLGMHLSGRAHVGQA